MKHSPGKGTTPRHARPASADPSIEATIKRLLDAEPSGTDNPSMHEDNSAPADAPMIMLVNALLVQAVNQGASDIHIEPFENILRVRYRVDGVLREAQRVPSKLAAALVGRLKVIAGLDICERRLPQDGGFKFQSEGVDAEFRISTLPSQFGEKVVLRILSRSGLHNDLSKLGIPEDQLALIRQAIGRPDGLILVTGPTGSGKTTTLYAALNELNDISVSVFTAEDPIEGSLPGVIQCQVNPGVGYTFASMLRSFLRQDPDVILVGEIRDQETAEVSIKAALTGHLVLSTLHTNCAVSTIQRLINMGVAPYLITSSANCIIAQRLVRRICLSCKEKLGNPTELLSQLGNSAAKLEGVTVYQGRGCKECGNTGFRGRAPIYEVLTFNDSMRGAVLSGASREQLKALAIDAGMTTLRESGLRLVREGITTIEEVLGATNEDRDVQSGAPLPSIPMPFNSSALAAAMMQFQAANPTTIIQQSEIIPTMQPPPVSAAPIVTPQQTTQSATIAGEEAAPQPRKDSPAGNRWKSLRQPRAGAAS